MKDVQVRKTISMVGQPGLLLALALVILAAVGWLNYREMAASADAVSARRLMAAQLAGAILASLLLLGAFALLKRQILARHCRQTEEAIRQSEERLSLAIAAASLGTWDRIIPSDEVVWSPRCYELFGLSPNTPMTYQRFLEAVHPEDRDRIERAVRADVEQHEDHEVEMRVVWPDGTIHFVAERGHAYYDPSGRPTRILGVAMDITRRKQAEEAVRQSEERLSLAVAAANLGTWDWDMLSDELVWSPRRFELFGLIPEDPMTYQRYLEAIHPEDRDRVDRAARAAAERHEDFDIEMRTVWPDGTVHFVAGHGRAQYDSLGRPTRMIGVAMDITKRKQAEEAVRQSEERLSLAIAAADLGTWDRTIVPDEAVWSPRGLELFGLSSETPMSYQRFLEAIHPEDRNRVYRAVRTAEKQHEDYYAEMRVVWPDGSIHYIASRGRAHYDPSGRPTRLSGVAMDITKRKQAEEAVRQSEERLSLAIAA
ncbi:MAG: sensor hybrid histidine kinase, partial [Pedosphaera sp.]|nr:sensor hybrid histidine kinase [Pedosphaera sp.]